jgi:hypothetical protein
MILVAIGTRDLGVLRTLASIVFGWGVSPLLVALYSSPGSTNVPPRVTTEQISLLQQLKDLMARLTSLLWPSGNNPSTSTQPTRLLPTHITKILITRHITDILRGSISVGWEPQAADEMVRQTVVGLLKMFVSIICHSIVFFSLLTCALIRLPASQAIVSLGGVNQPIRPTSIESEPSAPFAPVPVPAYVQKAASVLLSQQVLRPDGISGLCAAVFGEGDEGKL